MPNRSLTQLFVLLQKEWLLSTRSIMTTCVLLLAPAIWAAILGGVELALNEVGFNEGVSVGTLVPLCQPTGDCTSIGYTLVDHEDEVHRVVASKRIEFYCEFYREQDQQLVPPSTQFVASFDRRGNSSLLCTDDGGVAPGAVDTFLRADQQLCQQSDCVPLVPRPTLPDSLPTWRSRVHAVMAELADHNFGSPSSAQVRFFNESNYTVVRDTLIAQPNETQILLVFAASDSYAPPNNASPIDAAAPNHPLIYTIATYDRFNRPLLEVATEVAVRRALDVVDTAGARSPRIVLEEGDMPQTSAVNLVADVGAYCFGLTFFVNAIYIMYRVASEREQKMRLGLKMIGVADVAYWGSWLLVSLIVLLTATCLLLLTGAAFGVRYFSAASTGAVFLTIFTFGLAITPITLGLAMCLPSARSAMMTGFFLVIFSMIAILASTIAMDLLHTDSVSPTWVPFSRGILMWFPPFNLQKSILDVTTSTRAVLRPGEESTEDTYFTWDQVTDERSPCGPVTDELPDSCARYPSLADSLLAQVYIFLVSSAICLYVYAVLPSEGGRHPFFWATRAFWVKVTAEEAATRVKGDPVASEHLATSGDADVLAEQERVRTLDTSDRSAIFTVVGLGKDYAFRGRSKKPAVGSVSVSVAEGQVLVVLGRSGSGKSTLLSCVSGGTRPSWGDAFVCGHSARWSRSSVQQRLGICPQDNVQWPTLTALEHVELFGRLKGLAKEEARREGARLLEEVDLTEASDRRVGGFSGGMKRRVQLAMALMGNPDVVCIDEMSSGVDPANRRKLWEAVQRFKKGRCVVLTTHQMDEADVLGDKILIMSGGRLHALGTALHLKDVYGSGYRVVVTARQGSQQVDAMTTAVLEHLPNAVVRTTTQAQVELSLAPAHVKELVGFSRWLEEHADEEDFIVRDFLITAATLDSVFFAVGEDQ